MNKRLANSFTFSVLILATLCIAGLLITDSQAQDLGKKLPLEGETILLDGSVAFIIPVEEQPQSAVGQAQRIAKPWVCMHRRYQTYLVLRSDGCLSGSSRQV